MKHQAQLCDSRGLVMDGQLPARAPCAICGGRAGWGGACPICSPFLGVLSSLEGDPPPLCPGHAAPALHSLAFPHSGEGTDHGPLATSREMESGCICVSTGVWALHWAMTVQPARGNLSVARTQAGSLPPKWWPRWRGPPGLEHRHVGGGGSWLTWPLTRLGPPRWSQAEQVAGPR